MQIDLTLLLQILLYILLIALIIIFIILGIKAINMLTKVDKVIDDVEDRIHKTDSMFSLIDRVTDYTSSISDRVIGGIFNLVSSIFKKKGNDKHE